MNHQQALTDSPYFQDHLEDNICWGCGANHPDGLRIKSFWEGEEAICIWHSQEKYQGWKGILNGGVLASIVDCHCMNMAMAYAYKAEDRPLHTEPLYRYATGTMTVKYLLPTPNDQPIQLRARIEEVKGKKTRMSCKVIVGEKLTAEAEVIAIRVVDSSTGKGSPFSQK